MLIDPSCSEQRMPDCVCPEGFYMKNGKCVDLKTCHECVIEGEVKKVSLLKT
jgi:hypothetical protein